MNGRSAAGGVSVVVPARNVAATLPEQLAALLAQTTADGDEIVVADNGSTDTTAAVVQALSASHPHLRLVDADQRRGISHARNAGVAAARNDKVLFCDADDVVAPGWIEAMSAALDEFEGVGGKLDLDKLNGNRERRWRGEVSDPSVELVGGFLTRPFGANCGVRRAIWEQLGGFDEDFLNCGDDTEFFWRLQLAGYAWVYVDNAVVNYRLRPDLRSLARQFYLYGRTRPQLYRKFRDLGMPRSKYGNVLGTLWHVTTSASAAATGDHGGGTFVRDVAYKWGKLVGSAKYRCLYQ